MNSVYAPPLPEASSEPAPRGQTACKVARVVGILGGLGCLPLLTSVVPQRLWIAGLVAGALVVGAAAYHALALAGGARAVVERLRGRAPAASPLRLPTFSLAAQTGLIGLFLLLPAIPAFALRRNPGFAPGLLQIYLSTPAILIWVAAEILHARPWIAVQPKGAPELSVLASAGLQALGGLLLWVYLGLAAGTPSGIAMLLAAVGLSISGLLVGRGQEDASAGSAGEGEAPVRAAVGKPA